MEFSFLLLIFFIKAYVVDTHLIFFNKMQFKWNIGLVKGGYPVNIFLISPQKYMLWVLIRKALPRRF